MYFKIAYAFPAAVDYRYLEKCHIVRRAIRSRIVRDYLVCLDGKFSGFADNLVCHEATMGPDN